MSTYNLSRDNESLQIFKRLIDFVYDDLPKEETKQLIKLIESNDFLFDAAEDILLIKIYDELSKEEILELLSFD